MPQIIWNQPGNPSRGVAARLGITRDQLRNALHRIKADVKYGPTDRVIIWDDGSVSDDEGEMIGNVYDEI
ncbi:MAG TPA: hypothetical protein VMF86_15640 [Stellaceae bacterium]|nr:hypothetical protein [Stellaceae bacterium]